MPVPRQLRPRRVSQAPKKRAWVSEWLRSESFWRDVASRALSGLIVVVAGAAGAAGLGLIDWLTFTKVWLTVFAVAISIVVAMLWAVGMGRVLRRPSMYVRGKFLWLVPWTFLVTALVGVPVIGALFLLRWLLPLIYSW